MMFIMENGYVEEFVCSGTKKSETLQPMLGSSFKRILMHLDCIRMK